MFTKIKKSELKRKFFDYNIVVVNEFVEGDEIYAEILCLGRGSINGVEKIFSERSIDENLKKINNFLQSVVGDDGVIETIGDMSRGTTDDEIFYDKMGKIKQENMQVLISMSKHLLSATRQYRKLLEIVKQNG